MTYFLDCPRCGSSAFEALKTHSYCADCNYSPTIENRDVRSIPKWAIDAIKESASKLKKLRSQDAAV